jgi:ABC-type sugar transport system ATPase subunit
MSHLELRGIGKTFGATRALHDVQLEVRPGEILGVTGASGAGKSTLCRVVAGLEPPSEGDVLLDGRRATAVPPERRRVAMMFESYALYPQLTVFDNVAFPLRAPGVRRLARAEVAARVREVLRLVELEAFEHRRPAELSGGQKQRVALCRALVQEPYARVLDEPISHLDAKLRHVLRGAIRRRLVASETPTLWTTPDAGEALAVADRVAVLVAGRVVQQATPAEIYRRPATIEVARLVGDPPMNLVPGRLVGEAGSVRFQHDDFALRLAPELCARLPHGGASDGVVLGLRPSDVRISAAGSVTRGEVWIWEPLGKFGILTVRVGPDVLKIKVATSRGWMPGESVPLDLGAVDPVLFDAATGAAIQWKASRR